MLELTPRFSLRIPVLWSVISGATLWSMGAAEFWLLPLAAMITIGLMMRKTEIQV
jgi:hypothetical protein